MTEEENIERIKAIVLKRMKQTYKDGQSTKRHAHPKTHGMVRAKMLVEKGLPEGLCHGIFAKEKEYDVLVRLSASLQIVTPDLVQQPQGMSIKVFGVEGPKLLDGSEDAMTQDFVMINAPTFFTGDLGTYANFFEAQMEGNEAVVEFTKNNPKVTDAIGRMIAVGGNMNNVFAVPYWSQTPYKYGPHTIKFSTVPQSGATNDRPDKVLPEYLRDTMVETVANNEVRFEFVIQIQNNPETQPIEDPTVEWAVNETQEYRVATLIIPKQDLSSGTDLKIAEDLSFSAWHSIEDHKPLGAINRARRSVYKAGAQMRWDENGVKARKEPKELPQF